MEKRKRPSRPSKGSAARPAARATRRTPGKRPSLSAAEVKKIEARLRRAASRSPWESWQESTTTPQAQRDVRTATLMADLPPELLDRLNGMYGLLGKRGPDPSTIIRALVEWRTQPRKDHEAIVDEKPGAKGTLHIRLKMYARPKVAAREVRELLERKHAIDAWMIGGCKGEPPLPFESGLGTLSDLCRQDALIVMMCNAGLSYSQMRDFMAGSFRKGNKSVEGYVKKRVHDLKRALGPTIIRHPW